MLCGTRHPKVGNRRRHLLSAAYGSKKWSGRLDSNQRPPAPKAGALPGCATPRLLRSYHPPSRRRLERRAICDAPAGRDADVDDDRVVARRAELDTVDAGRDGDSGLQIVDGPDELTVEE